MYLKWFERYPGSPLRRGPRGMVLALVTIADGLIALLSLGLYWPHLWMVYFDWEAGERERVKR